MLGFKSQEIKSVIKDQLKKKKITYEQVAEHLKCSVPTVKRVLGHEEITVGRLLELCDLLELSLSDLEALGTKQETSEDRFTPEQQKFLVKNRGHFAYLMKIYSGETPAQIAEKNSLTKRSTDKYLIALEKLELIRVTGKQVVKPFHKQAPRLDDGPLGAAYFEAIINSGAKFFTDTMRHSMFLPRGERTPAHFGLQGDKVSKETYKFWLEEQVKIQQTLNRMAAFDQKTRSPEELKSIVYINATTLVENEDPNLKKLDNVFGEIKNI